MRNLYTIYLLWQQTSTKEFLIFWQIVGFFRRNSFDFFFCIKIFRLHGGNLCIVIFESSPCNCRKSYTLAPRLFYYSFNICTQFLVACIYINSSGVQPLDGILLIWSVKHNGYTGIWLSCFVIEYLFYDSFRLCPIRNKINWNSSQRFFHVSHPKYIMSFLGHNHWLFVSVVITLLCVFL